MLVSYKHLGIGETEPVLQEGIVEVASQKTCQALVPHVYRETVLCQTFGLNGEPRGCPVSIFDHSEKGMKVNLLGLVEKIRIIICWFVLQSVPLL